VLNSDKKEKKVGARKIGQNFLKQEEMRETKKKAIPMHHVHHTFKAHGTENIKHTFSLYSPLATTNNSHFNTPTPQPNLRKRALGPLIRGQLDGGQPLRQRARCETRREGGKL
jgi:hypothetical protein